MPTIRDHNVGWLRKEVYYPVQTSEAITIGTTAGSSQLQSQESTSSILALITGTKLVGLSVTGSGVDGTDWMEKIPFDVDLRFPIGIRPVYTKDATGASHTTVFTWTAKYSQIASKLSRVTYLNAGSTAIGPGSTILTASSALTTVIASSDTQAAATDSLQVYVGNQGTGERQLVHIQCVLLDVADAPHHGRISDGRDDEPGQDVAVGHCARLHAASHGRPGQPPKPRTPVGEYTDGRRL